MVVLLACSSSSKAQFVFIPDPNMRTALNFLVPGSVDASGYMDTLNAGLVLPEVMLFVSWSPCDLTGLQYLTAPYTYVEFLAGSSCTVSGWPKQTISLELNGFPGISLPPWPSTVALISLLTAPNLLSIPAFPSTLGSLLIKDVPNVSSLPPFPSSIASVGLVRSPLITDLPPLPPLAGALHVVNCASLSTIPTLGSVTTLTLDSLPALTTLPPVPASAQYVEISHAGLLDLVLLGVPRQVDLFDLPLAALPDLSGIREVVKLAVLPNLLVLPALTDSVSVLRLQELNISQLPDWTNAWVEEVQLYGLPNVASIQAFPQNAMGVEVIGMPLLTTLPAWSNADRIGVNSCPNVHCLPALPWGLTVLYTLGSGITCLPNLPPGLFEFEPVLPVCTVLDTCPILETAITGRVFHDLNLNGTYDVGEPPLPNTTVSVAPIGAIEGTDTLGRFALAPLPGTYTMTASFSNPYITAIVPATHTANLPTYADQDSLNDFAVQLQPGVQDLTLLRLEGAPVPGTNTSYGFVCTNNGTIPSGGFLTVTFDPALAYVQGSPTPSSVVANVVTWTIPTLPINGSYTVQLLLYTDSLLSLGTPMPFSAMLDPVATDATPANNLVNDVDTVVASYDPNCKVVEPAMLSSTEVAMGEELTYTIHFQNTGTYQASRVILTDTLSTDLQWNTMRYLGSSHACTWQIVNGVLYVVYDPIYLPDSASDELGSHGFVQFAMQPLSTLLNGNQVSNTANIYFDFNEPVITNTAVFTVNDASAVSELVHDQDLCLWPSPTIDVLYIAHKTERVLSVELLDLRGRPLLVAGAVDHLDVGQLAAGMYLARVTTSAGTYMRSVV
ncbi:MAG: DUF11 domain-containing protein, partial [Flavobacteriales bacterium]|nr:DUF11 domain-containing protein [Flavobacteriales bacterium]